MNKFAFDEVMSLNGQKLTKKYIAGLNKEERENLVDPIFQMIRRDLPDFPYPDDEGKVDKEWKRLVEYEPDLTINECYNNDSRATYIGKFYCKDFYTAIGAKLSKTMIEVFNDDDLMKRLIINRLGINWFEEEHGLETFSLTPKMMLQGIRSMHLTSGNITVFKPSVAKYLTLKYSNPGDTIYDYSAGWGARCIGAASAGRKYVAVDPLTTDDLELMVKHLKLTDITLIKSGSEDYCGYKDSIDFSYSSPCYFNQEVYSSDISQAYNRGIDYFYDIYWKKTLENVKYMLKPDKWFGLNVINYPKMLDMAKETFGEPVEIIQLKTTRSHLNKTGNLAKVKFEPVWLFRNSK